ncbi:MAG: hypothetical protein SEPTF4163_005209 [Sporothrix epigloea]
MSGGCGAVRAPNRFVVCWDTSYRGSVGEAAAHYLDIQWWQCEVLSLHLGPNFREMHSPVEFAIDSGSQKRSVLCRLYVCIAQIEQKRRSRVMTQK